MTSPAHTGGHNELERITMNIKAVMLASGLVIVGALGAAMYGCGGDDPIAEVPSRLARKGEACQTTNDCAVGLACMPPSSTGGVGTCVLGVFNVTETGKECAVVECQAATDCCDEPSSSCPPLKTQCDQQLANLDAGINPGSTDYCELYRRLCTCDPSTRDCENGHCVTKCVTDATCAILGGSANKCLGGKCAQCAKDEDCKGGRSSSDLICVNGECKAPCQTDGDCPGFERCVQGRCVEGGCQTDRECIAATRNVEATCGSDGRCIIPCQTDLECGTPKGYQFFSCVRGQCLYMGCESDKDCRLLLSGSTGSISGSGSSVTLSSKQHVVCQPKKIPNPTTQPAQ
jgi:hypothetical protein